MRAAKRYYSDQFQQVFGLPLEQGWQDWIAFEREFQRRNLAEVRKFPITPHRDLAASAVGSISRMYFDESSGILYGAFRYPGIIEHVGALNTRDGSVRRLADIKRRDAIPRHVVRLRPGERDGSSIPTTTLRCAI